MCERAVMAAALDFSNASSPRIRSENRPEASTGILPLTGM